MRFNIYSANKITIIFYTCPYFFARQTIRQFTFIFNNVRKLGLFSHVFLLPQPLFSQTDIGIVANDQMIQYVDPHQVSALDQAACEQQICL